MNAGLRHTICSVCAASVLLSGCLLRDPTLPFQHDHGHYATVAEGVAYQYVDPHGVPPGVPPGPPPPLTLSEYQALAPDDYWNLSLHEAIQAALVNSKVLRDLGATVLDAPANAETIHGPAIQETNPQFGIEGALAAFDADFSTSAFFENNDRALNNTFLGGGTRTLQQDLNVYQTQLRKQAATGTEFFLRSNVEYDSNNAPGNRFFSAYTSILEAEARQPLLQGFGVDYNRIAGPNAVPGVYNGVLIARINTDIELADFELALRDYISNVENAYWDLYYAYRDLDAKIDAREYALITWRKIYPQAKLGQLGADLEARAREQYYSFDVDVQNALAGRLLEGTRTDNGSSGGTFRGTGGVLVAERRLRLLMGVPISDGRLIRPCDEPIKAHVLFSWQQIVEEALTRRGELLRQRAHVKRRQMELVAAREFLKPRLDAVARYRWRGFGDDLLNPENEGRDEFDNSINNLTGGNFQEWQLGLELTFPIGFRRAHAAVRHAQLQLAREKAILHEQEQQILHDLSNALAELDRAYLVTKTSFNRLEAARAQLRTAQAAYEAEQTTIDQLLDAQRRLADAKVQYYLTLVEYGLAVKNVHFEKGSLMDYNDVYLAEGHWPEKAYHDAAERTPLPDHEEVEVIVPTAAEQERPWSWNTFWEKWPPSAAPWREDPAIEESPTPVPEITPPPAPADPPPLAGQSTLSG